MIKWGLTLLLFTFSTAHSQQTIKILSYNIFHGEQAYKKGEPNIDSVAGLINKYKPDLAAFQEVDSATGRSESIYKVHTDFIAELARKTGMHGFFGKAMDYDGGGYGEGLLTNKPARATVKILPTPKGGEPRALIYIDYPLSKKKKIVFAGTHLCHQFEENRIAQVTEINKTFESVKLPVILCGDLNFTPDKEPYRILSTAWNDAAILKGDPQLTFSVDNPKVRIDYAWLKKGHTFKVVDVQVLPYDYSDHKPVLITLEIQ
ncbi:endonuclease [Terrimonas sp.]|uniref:endonuclease/exonuclease/phosphatase family protein n=1 Tax=Terrimonas sp. TaxID=1914338 RepID=UPI000D512879|nr:endonuclease/exonuclease/phosphatase family protein [Terrimonas sp.]PVD53645.1 endonuclease [Terrimonas sp.]